MEHFKLNSQVYTSKEEAIDDTKESKTAEEIAAAEAKAAAAKAKEEEEEEEEETPKGPTGKQGGKNDAETNDEDLEKLRLDKVKEISAIKEEERTDAQKEFLNEFGDQEENTGYKFITNSLVEKGLIELPEDFDLKDDEDTFAEVLTYNTKAGIEKYKESLGDDAKDFLKFVENGGNPRDYYSLLQEEDYSEADVTNVNHQKYLIEDYYIAQGRTKEDAREQIELLEENNKLEKEAKVAQSFLVKAQESKKETLLKDQEEKAKAQAIEANKKLEKLKSSIFDKKDIEGFSITKKEQTELFDYMTKPVKNGKTQYQIDSGDFNNLVKQAYFMKKKFNFEKLGTKVKSTEVSKLREALDKVSKSDVARKTAAQKEAKTEKDEVEVTAKLPRLTFM